VEVLIKINGKFISLLLLTVTSSSMTADDDVIVSLFHLLDL